MFFILSKTVAIILRPSVLVCVIGVIGLVLEKLVFQRLEHYTVVRWGMVTA